MTPAVDLFRWPRRPHVVDSRDTCDPIAEAIDEHAARQPENEEPDPC